MSRKGLARTAGRGVLESERVKILLIEDDAEAAQFAARGLKEAGHVVDLAGHADDGEHLAIEGHYDVFVVDRMLPGGDGLSIVKRARAAGVSTPVLFLTAMSAIGDRVDGLQAGGDDYLVKPYAFSELLARIQALGRRSPALDMRDKLKAGDIEVDLGSRTARRSGIDLDLTPQEFRLLEFLVRHAGLVVTREMLLQKVWGFDFEPRANLIDAHMSRLRAKVDKPFGHERIQTARGTGYRLSDLD